ncbi:type I secretion outer membrane protein, TolC [Paraglaciecola chathamensis]|uniref:Type I secretion outer membrane protein, TolC n=1 Tax=Paraglaciecola agarilytica NO2 TaxID=1125747 RepID=A0ABQ0ICC4_9ALTE|nr:type I secretion outer membrane protein, TolC [Paraglaciecola agarilytica]GAC06925.1 type I secretion outer membrane protein, TolC [Paraglaciecola agarilytica NO2]
MQNTNLNTTQTAPSGAPSKSSHVDASKRQFLHGGATLGSALLLAGISNTSRAHEPEKKQLPKAGRSPHGSIIGHGDFQYKVNYNWGRLDPHKVPVENSHGLAIDAKGRIIMATDSDVNNFVIYNKDGKLLDAWGTQYPGAHSVKISHENGEDFIYIVDCGWVLDRNRPDNQWKNKWYRQSGFIAKLTIDGKLVYTIGHPVTLGIYTPDMRYQPTDLTVAPNGDLYVTDGYGSDFVIHYDSNGRYIRHWGGTNNADPALNLVNTHGVGVDTRDPNNQHLLVSSRGEQTIKKYSMQGKWLGDIHLPGAYVGGPVFKGEHFYAPVCWSHIDGKMAANSGFITILDKHNRVVSNPGGLAPEYVDGQLQPMQTNYQVFNHCHCVCVDDDENLYVGQWNANQMYPIKLERV